MKPPRTRKAVKHDGVGATAAPPDQGRDAAQAMVPSDWSMYVVYALLALFFGITVGLNLLVHGEQQFAHLANAFLHGQTYFIERPGSWGDTVAFNGRHYWPLGPFPSVLLMPLVLVGNAFGFFFYQGYLQPVLVAGVFLLVYRIGRRFRYSPPDSLFWGFTFTFGSVFLGVALWPWSWQFSQVVSTFAVFWVIVEYLGKRRYWLIGFVLACVLATRINASFAIAFFVLDLLFDASTRRTAKLRALGMLLVPYVLTLGLLAVYNAVRFGSPSEIGYSLQSVPAFLEKTRSHGLFSPSHLAGNLYYFLFSTPTPVFLGDGSQVLTYPYVRANPRGMSILVTTPILLVVFLLKNRDRFTKIVSLSVLVIALPIFLYYGIGFRQLGFRYALDFLPFLFLIMIRNYRLEHDSLSAGFKLLVVSSAFANLYLFFTIFQLK